ncbi:unnamed protein product [Tetraodon nigroviridis]|nr:unnamed protein product [Tetraodon nigroviridis]
METKLEALQCHFTWELDDTTSRLLQLGEKLEDIGTEEGRSWLGHIYNLQGYIQHRLGFAEQARSFFNKSEEAFRQIRKSASDTGPWLLVNYGNRAWWHHLQGEHAESQAYLAKVDALTEEHPSPSQEDLHPDIYAEKAWTLMKFGPDQKLLAVEYFQRAIRMQPDMVEWHSSHILVLVSAFSHSNAAMMDGIFEKMKIASKHDPENLHLAALYVEARARNRKQIQEEVRELARRLLKKAVSSYSGLKAILRLYRMYLSYNEAIDLAEEVLERHPQERYAKKCAAVCYCKKILLHKHLRLEPSLTSRAIALCTEVISLYPHSALKTRIALANVYGQLNRRDEAQRIYDRLLQSELDPEQAQMLYCYYAKYANVVQRKSSESAEYYMRAAGIPVKSVYRDNSLRILERIQEGNQNPKCREIEKFLAELQL